MQNFRDKAPRPSAIHFHNPLDSFTCFNPWNYVHNWNLTNDHKKERVHHTCRNVLIASTWSTCPCWKIVELRTLLGQSWKGIVVAASGYAVALLWKVVSPQVQRGSCFNTHSTDVWKPWKKGQLFSLYLDELSIQKCKIQRSFFNVSIFSLGRLFPEGVSCHPDESSMNHTLAQKISYRITDVGMQS